MMILEPLELDIDSSNLQDGQERFIMRLKFNPVVELVAGIGLTFLALYFLLKKPDVIEIFASKMSGFVGKDTELDRSAL